MAEKKTPAASKATPKKAPARKKAAKGDSYECEMCGFAITIDEACDCAEVHEFICCGEPMKEKKVKVKAKK